jgi:hypothetical protein
MKRIDTGLKGIANSGKSVGGDFERIASQGKRLATIFGTMAIAGTAALVGWVKDTPAVAGSMAKIKLSMLKLKMAAGEALAPAFEKVANGLSKLSGWADNNDNLFGGILTSIATLGAGSVVIGVGGWIYKQYAAFFGLFKGMVNWGGWATIGTVIGNVATKIGGFFSSAIAWFAKIPGVLKNFLFGGGASAGVAGGMAVGAAAGGMMVGPLVNTYQREMTGEPGFLDKQLIAAKEASENMRMQKEMKKWSRNGGELDAQLFV